MIQIGEKEYAIGFGPVALDSIENVTGVSLSEWNADKFSHQYALIYSCVKQGCRNERKKFEVSYEDFIDQLPTDETYLAVLNPCLDLLIEQFKAKKKKKE